MERTTDTHERRASATAPLQGVVDVRGRGQVSRRALRREANRVLAQLDQLNPGVLDRRDRETWTPTMLDQIWRELWMTE